MGYFYLAIAFVVYMILGLCLTSFIEGMFDSDQSSPSYRFSFDSYDFWVYFLTTLAWPIWLFVLVFFIFVLILGKIIKIFSNFLFYLTDKCINFVSKHKSIGILNLSRFCYEMGYFFARKFFSIFG